MDTFKNKYADLLSMRRPVHVGDAFSRRHPRMSGVHRAKLFAPFAALAGFDEAIRAKQVPYVQRRTLDEDAARALNAALCALSGASHTKKRLRVVYFEVCRDPNSEAFGQLGLYHRIEGVARGVDLASRALLLEDRRIAFDDLFQIVELREKAQE